MTTRATIRVFPLLWLLCLPVLAGTSGLGDELPGPFSPLPQQSTGPLRLPPEQLPARFRGQTVVRRPVMLREKVIALTFDDGPDPDITPDVLEILRQYKAPATFFVIGERGKRWPDLIQREARAGHAVESHSYSHPTEEISLWHAWRELQRAAIVIQQWTGRPPTLFRPPYGNVDDNLSKEARRAKMCVVKWTICGSDNPRLTAADIVEAVTAHPESGDIVLLHDGRDRRQTVRALPEILRRLTEKGFRFVTMPQLLRRWDVAEQRSGGRHANVSRRHRDRGTA